MADSPCIDCGNNAPAPKLRQALFFDLDHSLIRPKVQVYKGGSFPESASDEFKAKIKEGLIARLPKNICELEYFLVNDLDKEGYSFPMISYRNIFPKDAEDWEYVPGILDAIGPFVDAGFMFVIISNQGGIEAGFHTEAEVEEKLSNVLFGMSASLGSKMLDSCAYFYCPSLKEHPDRKPNPGMILRAADKLGIDLYNSFFVGDMESDDLASRAAGVGHFFYPSDFIQFDTKIHGFGHE